MRSLGALASLAFVTTTVAVAIAVVLTLIIITVVSTVALRTTTRL